MYKRIVLAYDGSQSGQQALLDCQDLAQWSQAELALVAVLPLGIGLVATEGGIYDAGLMERVRPPSSSAAGTSRLMRKQNSLSKLW